MYFESDALLSNQTRNVFLATSANAADALQVAHAEAALVVPDDKATVPSGRGAQFAGQARTLSR